MTKFQDKFGRSVEKIFKVECGYKMEKVEKITGRYDDMLTIMYGWTQRCKRYEAADCPLSRCEIRDDTCRNLKN